jgi:hypothetical protein
MLDAICNAARDGGATRSAMARSLLVAVLEDDAAAHQGCGSGPDRVVYLKNWRGSRARDE